MKPITAMFKEGVVLGDGGYLIELERRGYVDSGSRRENVGTGKGSGQFTPEVAIENPDALRQLHREFLHAGSQVLQALTFFGTREKLNRAGYGAQTEEINSAAVRIAIVQVRPPQENVCRAPSASERSQVPNEPPDSFGRISIAAAGTSRSSCAVVRGIGSTAIMAPGPRFAIGRAPVPASLSIFSCEF